MKTLYLCYFGINEPLVQTQVLPYLRAIAGHELEVYLLTFEPHKLEAEFLASERMRLQADGIHWSARAYHKRPTVPATLYDIAAGALAATQLVQRHKIDVIHARAHIPMAMAMLTSWLTRCRLIFDIRGLMAEEYADAGIWSEGSLKFRVIKWLELKGIEKADQIVVLTHAMKNWLVQHRLKAPDQIEVIPCCVSLSGDNAGSQNSEVMERFEIVYAGSVTGLYRLEEMGKFFLELRARRPDVFLRILTTSNQEEAARRLVSVGLHTDAFAIGSVAARDVPSHLRRAGIGLSFRKKTFSQLAASPTKIPEYLAAGLPVVSNQGIGDMDGLLESERVGVLVRDFTPEEFARAAELALELARDSETGKRCVEVARTHFDLQSVGAVGYANVYRRIESAIST